MEHLITDFWARFQKMRGHECLAFCADDTHGAPIMVEARKKGIKPEQQIAKMAKRHLTDFSNFEVYYDHYSSTHSPVNKELCDSFYKALREASCVEEKSVEQYYCLHDKMFLPDRFVKGECPRCGAHEQYGDSCDACGAVYNPIELKDPKCSICGLFPNRENLLIILLK